MAARVLRLEARLRTRRMRCVRAARNDARRRRLVRRRVFVRRTIRRLTRERDLIFAAGLALDRVLRVAFRLVTGAVELPTSPTSGAGGVSERSVVTSDV